MSKSSLSILGGCTGNGVGPPARLDGGRRDHLGPLLRLGFQIESGGDDGDIISSRIVSSMTAPKMMLASGSTVWRMISAASLTSKSVRSELAGDVEEHAAWRPSMVTSSSGLVIACWAASTARVSPVARPIGHQRRAAVRHDRLDVGKVQVDQAGHGDQVRDALDALAQHVIGDAEGLLHGRLLVHDLQQPIVGDDDQRVDLLAAGP